jgi:hypothetical protein
MKQTKAQRQAEFYARFAKLGFSFDETNTLRRAEMTLSRWSTAECNGEIERDEATGKPVRVSQAYINGFTSKRTVWPVADRERGALARINRIMQAHPDFVAYHQGDPRGCSLYIVAKKDLPDGADINAYYSRGFAVCF